MLIYGYEKSVVDQQTTEITETVLEQSQPVNINIYELR